MEKGKEESAVWKVGCFARDRKDATGKFICEKCGKAIAASDGNTSGLSKHISAMHKLGAKLDALNAEKAAAKAKKEKPNAKMEEAVQTKLDGYVKAKVFYFKHYVLYSSILFGLVIYNLRKLNIGRTPIAGLVLLTTKLPILWRLTTFHSTRRKDKAFGL